MNKLVILIASILTVSTFNEPVQANSKEIIHENRVIDESHQIQKVNLNTASAEEIASILKGVGITKAAEIVSFRETHGEFEKIEDLAAVKGIGVVTIANNRARITL